MKKNGKNNNGSEENNSDRRNEKRKRGIRGRGGKGGRGCGRGGFNSKKIAKVLPSVQPHRLEGVYIIKTQIDNLATKNLSVGESYYGEELISLEEIKEENSESENILEKNKVEYRIWDAFKSKLGASIINGIYNIFMKPGSKVLYLGAGNDSYSTITHISDIVGEKGIVYGVEISEIKGLDLNNITKKRENIIPIINDARKPFNYKTIIQGLVDCIFTDISSPDISNIISMNAGFFLKNKGGFICIIKNEICNFNEHIKLLREYNLYAKEFLTLEPFKTGFATVSGIYKP